MNPLFVALMIRAVQSKHVHVEQSPTGFALVVNYFGMNFQLSAISNEELGYEPVPETDLEPAPQPAPPPPGRPNLRLVQ